VYGLRMEPTDLTIRLLQEIRDEIRRTGERADRGFAQVDQRFEQVDRRFEQVDRRFEVIETTLRDLAEQMVMLARGIKTALDHRSTVDTRIDKVERRLDALENAAG
jgi:chromosome segregation ATPase